MVQIIRTQSDNTDFLGLVKLLDAELAARDGDDHAFFAALNKVDMIKHVVLLYENEVAVGCGAMKHYEEGVMEVKRMYVAENKRSRGLASQVLQALENWAIELGYKRFILETGIKQPEAISLYTKNRYQRIPNFGKYIGIEESVCFEKLL
ncbi:acetyltransferase (GNAT) family protein [Chitinophaga skermanii]|uniref:Acetyltransferase (GNAT) family protein n=1 Tax=Chitinophaga skermanii TaxID=331697 RepID=A0A327QWX7_9BACT|nr:GNAT family N-acetyltransferase [Chitinophaga skermanii]RAJ08831.1 acetyltransferase (GNAT) family protein [Chitinophaga skermanii]